LPPGEAAKVRHLLNAPDARPQRLKVRVIRRRQFQLCRVAQLERLLQSPVCVFQPAEPAFVASQAVTIACETDYDSGALDPSTQFSYESGDRRLLVHELAHVAQYERFGGFRRFLFQYLQECINPGYPLGDLELEAKRAEESSC